MTKIFIGLALLMGSCARNETESYKINCRVDAGVYADSVRVYQLEEDYNAVRMLGEWGNKADGSEMTLSGSVDVPRVAFVSLDSHIGKSVVYFIIENADINLRIGNGYLNMEGGRLCKDYFGIFAERRGVVNKRKTLRKRYMELVAANAVTDSIDRAFADADKALADSLQRLYRRAVDAHDVVATAVWCQYGNEMNLTPVLNDRLKPDSLFSKMLRHKAAWQESVKDDNRAID